MTRLLIKAFIKDANNIKNPKVRTSYGKFAGVVGIVCNFLLFTSKLIIGFLTSSVSIIADAINNLSDASSGLVSLVGFKLSSKPADEEHPYGHGRYEYLSALFVAIIVMVIGVELFKSSVEKIINPKTVEFGLPLVLVLVISIAVKLWLMKFNKVIGEKIESNTLIASSYDSRNDVISTLAILFASIISYYTGYELDGWIGLLVSAFILVSGFYLVKNTIDPMLGSAPNAELTEIIKDKILSYQNIIGVHDLIIHDYGPSRKFASVHVEMPAEENSLKSHEIIDNIERDLFTLLGIHLIIHFDPIITNTQINNDIYSKIEKVILKIDERLSIHDLRLVSCDNSTHIYFDCLSPKEIDMDDALLIEMITKEIQKIDASYICHITVDKSFVPVIK